MLNSINNPPTQQPLLGGSNTTSSSPPGFLSSLSSAYEQGGVGQALGSAFGSAVDAVKNKGSAYLDTADQTIGKALEFSGDFMQGFSPQRPQSQAQASQIPPLLARASLSQQPGIPSTLSPTLQQIQQSQPRTQPGALNVPPEVIQQLAKSGIQGGSPIQQGALGQAASQIRADQIPQNATNGPFTLGIQTIQKSSA